jgi:type II secretory pathway pseudopilin PulG
MGETFVTPIRAARAKNAFSLVEIVIAIGVATFALVTILSLLPVGLRTAQQSRNQSRAAYLAEQIVSDLRSSSFNNASILSPNTAVPGSPLTALSATINLAAAPATTNFLYLQCDGQNNVLATATASQYANGVSTANVNYLVQIGASSAPITNLSTVSVEVSAPAQGALTSRSRYGFQTMIGNRQ